MSKKNTPLGKKVIVTHVATGKKVTVYRRRLGGWVNYSDCTTIYKSGDLDFG